jgi:anthranilate phosphoribosyltransferase
MKEVLSYLYEGNTLGREESEEVLMQISSNRYTETEIASFITVYLMRGVTPEELTGFRNALLKLCIRVEFPGIETIDVCGTGGDGKNTFNISTLSAFVLAGTGVRVAKHGNFGVSSPVGSSDLLQYLGYRFKNDEVLLRQELETAGITFLHAPLFHPAMKYVAPVRKTLQTKTFFNMLGPMINPSFPDYRLMGVYSGQVQELVANVFRSEKKPFMVIHAMDGYDEISLTGETKIVSGNNEETIDPSTFGFSRVNQDDLFGGYQTSEAASIFMNVLTNRGTTAQKNVVVANAAAALRCIHPETSWSDCTGIAMESLDNGSALRSFNRLISMQ